MIHFVLVSLACAAISTTIARSKLTGPLRDAVRAKNPFIGQALSCPYCLSHWVSFFLVLFSGISTELNFGWLLSNLVMWFSVVALAAMFNGVIMRLNFMHEKELERLEQTLDDTNKALKELLESLP